MPIPLLNVYRLTLGGTSINQFVKINLRNQHTPRGKLPWECGYTPCKENQKTFRKKEFVKEQECPDKCDVLKRPKRNTYEWVTNEEEPCKPFGTKIVERTICEMRRLKKCIKLFQSESKCQNLAPDCTRNNKVYPMAEAVQKNPLPGCDRPIPHQEIKEIPDQEKKEK